MGYFSWWLLPDSNWGHKALQASALPTELKSHDLRIVGEQRRIFKLPIGLANLASVIYNLLSYAGIAQLLERFLAKEEARS